MGKEEEKAAVYQNRRRIRGERGKRLLRQRGELVERSFAHLYETGAMRRTHLPRHDNIIKRLLIHASAFNLGLMMRKAYGCGTPRRLRDAAQAWLLALRIICGLLRCAVLVQLLRSKAVCSSFVPHSNVVSIS